VAEDEFPVSMLPDRPEDAIILELILYDRK